MKLNEDLYSLPFDQFSRQFVVANVVDKCLRNKSKKTSLSIIDLGGHAGKTSLFHPVDKVTILDVFNEKYKGYVKGDATDTKFKDNTFDIACSFDVFEHIPRSKRARFITEALRISREGIFIAAPIDDDKKQTSAAESGLNEFYKDLFGSDHRWLKEHIDYKIPDSGEIEGLIKNTGASFTAIPSNNLGDWILMQALIFMTSKNPLLGEQMEELNRWFNKNTISLDANSNVHYRQVYFISNNKPLVRLVSKYVASQKKENNVNNKLSFDPGAYKKALKIIASNQKFFEGKIKELERENKKIKNELTEVYSHNQKLTKEITDIYQSKSWKITKPARAIDKLRKKQA